MTRDFLRDFGLNDDQITDILNQAGRELGAAVNKKESEYSAIQADLDEYKNKLDTAEKTIKELEKSNSDNEALQKQIEKYKDQIEQQSEKARIDRIDMGIELALTQAGAKNPKTVKPLLDMDKILLTKDGSLTGVDEQIKALTESEENSYLFKSSDNAAEVPKPLFGGYEPQAGEAKTESFGMMMGKRAHNHMQDQLGAADNFWSSFQDGSIK